MPSRTMDFTKAQRMLLVRRAIETYGEVDVRFIREFLSANYGFENNETLRRRIYEDLNDLHGIREIEFHYFNDDGSEMDDGRRVYTLRDERQSIVGVKSLKEFGGEFLTPSGRKIPWQITDKISLEPTQGHKKIIFNTGTKFYVLSLLNEALPATLVIGRTFNHKEFEFPTSNFVKTYGARASYLGLPYGELSIRSDESSIGHVVLKFDSSGVVTISDLNTANHTEVCADTKLTLIPEIYGLVFNDKLPASYRFAYPRQIELTHEFERVQEIAKSFSSTILLRLGRKHLFVIGEFNRPKQKLIEEVVDIKKWRVTLGRRSREMESTLRQK